MVAGSIWAIISTAFLRTKRSRLLTKMGTRWGTDLPPRARKIGVMVWHISIFPMRNSFFSADRVSPLLISSRICPAQLERCSFSWECRSRQSMISRTASYCSRAINSGISSSRARATRRYFASSWILSNWLRKELLSWRNFFVSCSSLIRCCIDLGSCSAEISLCLTYSWRMDSLPLISLRLRAEANCLARVRVFSWTGSFCPGRKVCLSNAWDTWMSRSSARASTTSSSISASLNSSVTARSLFIKIW